jgi:hypothetical protein
MLWSAFVILLLLWLAGVVASYTLGGLIHLLLVMAVLTLLAQVVTRQREPAARTHESRSEDDERDRPHDEGAA